MNPTHTLPTTDVTDLAEPADTAPAAEVVEVTPADILRAAACYITLHGWTQGYYYEPAPGNKNGDFRPNPTPPACAMGAIAMAAYGGPIDAPFESSRLERRDFACAAVFFTDYLDIRHGDFNPEMSFVDLLSGPDIGTWNDQPGRTAEQVIAALLAAADDWDKTHGTASDGGAQ